MLTMKTGKMVAVCYDGKLSRCTIGRIIKTHRGHHITVRFKPWSSEHEIEAKFRIDKARGVKYISTRVRHEGAIMPWILAMYGVQVFGDYYTVYRRKPCLKN